MFEDQGEFTPLDNPNPQGLKDYFAMVEEKLTYIEYHDLVCKLSNPFEVVMPMAQIVTFCYMKGYSVWRCVIWLFSVLVRDFIVPEMALLQFFERLADVIQEERLRADTNWKTVH